MAAADVRRWRRATARWPARRSRAAIVAAFVLLALAAIAVKGWRVYGGAQTVREDLRAIQAAAGAGMDGPAIARLGELLAKTRADTAALREEAAPLLQLTPYLGWVPVYGGDLAAAGPIVEAGAELTAAADEAFAALAPLLEEQGLSGISGARLRDRLAASAPQVEAARAALGRAAERWAQVPVDSLSPALRGQAARVDRALPLARLALEVAPLLPAALDDVERLEAYTRSTPDRAALAALGPLLAKTRADMAALRAAAAPLLPTVSGSEADADLAAAGALLDAATELSGAASEAFDALAPIALQPGDGPVTAEVMERLLAARPRLEAAREAAARGTDALARAGELPPALRERLGPVDGLAAGLRDGLDLALALPGLLGAGRPAEYLLIAQNPDEMRATGGFISAAGMLRLDGGRPGEVELRNSPSPDDIGNQVYPQPPGPLLRYMGIEMLLLRDSNWSPDFPAAARAARELYAAGEGSAPGSVVAFDPYAVELVLEAIGPVPVEGSEAPITHENVLDYLRAEHGREQGPEQKAYIGRLANAIVARIEAAGDELDAWALLTGLRRALAGRHLLLALEDPAAAAVAARRGWDGAVRPGDGDYLLVVDSNLGYNKASANVAQEIGYAVDLRDPATPAATLTVRLTHLLQRQAPCAQLVAGQGSYAEWMERCHYSYLRALVPGGSRLLGAETEPVPGAWMAWGEGDDGAVQAAGGPAGTVELGVFQVIPFGTRREVVFHYRLPAGVVVRDGEGWRYRLRLQKQPGTEGIPYDVAVALPPGAALVSASPAPERGAGDTLTFAGRLDVDRAIEIRFENQ